MDMHTITDTPPLKEYRLAKGVRIFFTALCVSVVALCLWVSVVFATQAVQKETFFPVVMCLLALVMGAFFAWGLLEVNRNRLLVQEHSLKGVGAFFTTVIMFSDIKGYKTDEHYLYIYPGSGRQKIKFSRFVSGYPELINWLHENFANLDLAEAMAEYQQLTERAEDEYFQQDNESKLRSARWVARTLNFTGVLLCLWLVALKDFKEYYSLSISFAIAFPVLILLALFFFRGFLGLHDNKQGAVVNSPVPSLMTAVLFPPIVLVLRTFVDFYLLDSSALWPPAAAIAFVLILGFYLSTSSLKSIKSTRYGLYGIMIVSSAAYGYSIAYLGNCLYDSTTPTTYSAPVLDKRFTKGKMSSHYLKLSSWSSNPEHNELQVSAKLYKQVSAADSVVIHLHQGWLKAPWYEVEAKEQ